MGIIKYSLPLNIYLAFGFHIVVSFYLLTYFGFQTWNLELGKYFSYVLINILVFDLLIKHLLNFLDTLG